MPRCVVNRSLLRVAHPMLDLGEGLFGGVEVRGVGWQIPEPCAGGLDHLADGGRFVRAEIVHDHDVAGFEHRHEQLLDIGPEALTVDRSVEDARRGKAVAMQRA